jgi:hypothetical protein
MLAVTGVASAQITNGGFETGTLSGWTVLGTNPTPVVTNSQPHSGTFAALLGTDSGGEPLGDGSIYQQFAVGAGGTLSFWHQDFTTDSITFDWQDAYITDTSNNILATIMHQCSTSQGYVNQTFDMTPFANQTVRLQFLVHQDGFGDDTSMRVDDVTFTPVPEPASMAALGVGALALLRRRRKNA